MQSKSVSATSGHLLLRALAFICLAFIFICLLYSPRLVSVLTTALPLFATLGNTWRAGRLLAAAGNTDG